MNLANDILKNPNYSLLVVRNRHSVTDDFYLISHLFYIYHCHFWKQFVRKLPLLLKILRLLVALHHQILKYLHHLLLVHWSITSFIPLGSPSILSHVPLLVAVIAAKLSLLSSVIVALSLGFLRAISLHMSGLITSITISQGDECVITICVEYIYPGLSRVGCCIDNLGLFLLGL